MKLSPLIRLARPKQWTKNFFVFAPVVFSFKLLEPHAILAGLVASLIFCLCASCIYIVNDLRDIEADRIHPKKSRRPLASAQVSPPEALSFLGVLLLGLAALLWLAAPGKLFILFLAIYAILSLWYSLGLKHVTLLELFIVASGYVLRVLAGCAAIGEIASPWILAATGAVALLIVAGKRRSEIAERLDPDQMRQSLKGYNLVFLDNMITMLAATCVVTYLLFTTSDYAISRYHTPYLVATSPFVLYGVLRYMQVVAVSSGGDDPTTLVLSDRSLRRAVLVWMLSCIALIYFK